MTHVPGIKPKMGSVEWSLLIALSMLWGGSFFFAEVALEAFGPLSVVLARVGLAAVVLSAVALVMGHRLPADPRPWAAYFVMGALNNLIPFSLIVWGQVLITGALASILNATTPLFTVVLAHALTRDERMTAARAAGVLCGLAGVVVMIGREALGGFGLHVAAQLAVLAAALSYALAGIFGRRFRGTAPVVTAAGQVIASTVMIGPLALIVERPWTVPAPGLEVWAALAGLAVLSTALAYVIYFRILAASGATNLLLVTFLIPISAILLGVAILGERLSPAHLAGMALIALGLAAIDGRPLGALRRRRASGRM